MMAVSDHSAFLSGRTLVQIQSGTPAHYAKETGFLSNEEKRLGTVFLLAAIDLLTGEAIPLVCDNHA